MVVIAICGCDQGPATPPVATTNPAPVASKPTAPATSNTNPQALVELPASATAIGMEFKLISAGTYTRGDGDTAHVVVLTKAFSIGVHEVTQAQFQRVMGSNPSEFKGPQHPVEGVSWREAVEFCSKLSALPAERAAGRVYRLPTEAEWEYACRAGTKTEYSFGDSDSKLGDYAWYGENSGSKTHAVGGKQPNAWGLHDMHGNVWEWCRDSHAPYPSGNVTDPSGPASGAIHVIRGGGWSVTSEFCRSAYRSMFVPSFRVYYLGGFRVCLDPSSN